MNERVLAIIVSYNPDCQQLGCALTALEEQVSDILIVDNGQVVPPDVVGNIQETQEQPVHRPRPGVACGAVEWVEPRVDPDSKEEE